MMCMDVFFLSGLGADKTVFQFLDHSRYHPVFIDWLSPEKRESLEEYALRLKEEFMPDDAIIVGLSFGGMLATEIAKKHPDIKSILISSAKTKYELPSIYRTGKYFPLHQWSPHSLQKWFMMRIRWMFGVNRIEAQKIYADIIRNSDPAFNQWAIDAILDWENSEVPSNVIHIHGTHDKILPYKNVQSHYAVKKGGHLMVMEQADILSEFLNNIIENKEPGLQESSSSENRSAYLFQV
jgi:pimeloyl-ACP methyl ester carboxylesterase